MAPGYILSPSRQNVCSLHMRHVTLSGNPVYYRQAGQGPPLLLVHGWGGSSRNWQTTFNCLADIRSIYAPDLPGYGESPPFNDSDTPGAERLALLLIEFADALGLETFDINGHSFGAGLGAYIAAHWPHRVRRLILTCFSTFRTELERRMVEQAHRQMNMWMALWQPWMVLWEPWMALWQPWMARMGGMKPVYRAMASRFFYQVPADETLVREGFADFLRMDRRTALEGALSSGSPIITAALEQVQVPTLLIGAREDTVMLPSNVEVVAHLLPSCTQVWIDQCGHLPMLEKPEEYHRIVREFLTSEDTAGK